MMPALSSCSFHVLVRARSSCSFHVHELQRFETALLHPSSKSLQLLVLLRPVASHRLP